MTCRFAIAAGISHEKLRLHFQSLCVEVSLPHDLNWILLGPVVACLATWLKEKNASTIPLKAVIKRTKNTNSPFAMVTPPKNHRRIVALLALGAAFAAMSSCVMTPEMAEAMAAGAGRPTYQPAVPYQQPAPYAYSRPATPYGNGPYSSGYYPYSAPPRNESLSVQKAHAYEVGFRVGQDDFHHKRPKHMDQHKSLFDDATHDSFRDGYEAGYDAARRSKR